jgi:hypothetical protein
MYDGTTGAVINGNEITLHLVDGKRGDHDLTANGEIVEPGAPGRRAEGGAPSFVKLQPPFMCGTEQT